MNSPQLMKEEEEEALDPGNTRSCMWQKGNKRRAKTIPWQFNKSRAPLLADRLQACKQRLPLGEGLVSESLCSTCHSPLRFEPDIIAMPQKESKESKSKNEVYMYQCVTIV